MPGFDQWIEGQIAAGAFYSGVAFVGLSVSSGETQHLINADLTSDDNEERIQRAIIGGKTYATAASLSAYASFRSAVRVYHQQGSSKFKFLPEEERVDDLLLAPFAFSEFLKPTVYIPLGLLTVYMVGEIEKSKSSNQIPSAFGGNDILFSGAISYYAGVEEEAFFRGWLQPMAMQWSDSEWLSVGSTGYLFGAAHPHYNGRFPWLQTILGWYLGYLTVKNDWSLQESIFLHTWWDVIAFTGGYIQAAQGRSIATIWLPTFRMSF